MKSKKLIIITDLDGTLIDLYDQTFDPVLPYLNFLIKKKVPVVFCSAKTRAEQERLRKIMNITDPFVVENGGAIFIPENYFSFKFTFDKLINNYKVIELGIPYEEIRKTLKEIREKLNLKVVGFGDLKEEELSRKINVDVGLCKLAKKREYDETLFLDELSLKEKKVFLEELKKRSLRWSYGGRFFHIHGNNDKGKAINILKRLFKKEYGEIFLVGLGDTKNDVPMFEAVDMSFLIQKKDGSWEEIDMPNIKRINGIGPVGWAKAIEELTTFFNKT